MRKGQMHDTDPMLAAGINENLIRNPYVPGSRYQTIKNDGALSTIPNSGVFRPKEAKGRADWLVFSGKALQARDDLTADQRKFATGANIQVQGLRDEVQKGNFRQDLFYRLNTINIQVPSLKNHISDIHLYFLPLKVHKNSQ